MVEEGPQVVLPVPVRNNDGCVMPRLAVRRLVATTRQHQGVPATDLLQGQRRGQVDGDRPHWKRRGRRRRWRRRWRGRKRWRRRSKRIKRKRRGEEEDEEKEA